MCGGKTFKDAGDDGRHTGRVVAVEALAHALAPAQPHFPPGTMMMASEAASRARSACLGRPTRRWVCMTRHSVTTALGSSYTEP